MTQSETFNHSYQAIIKYIVGHADITEENEGQIQNLVITYFK